MNDVRDFLMFRVYLTPWLIRIGWWILLAFVGVSAGIAFWNGRTETVIFLLLVLAAWRVLAELSMVLFGILEELRRHG